MFSKIQIFLIGLGSGILSALSIIFFFLSKKEEQNRNKANQLRKKHKDMERKKDAYASKQAKSEIERKIEKKKEALNENDIHELTRKFNSTFND